MPSIDPSLYLSQQDTSRTPSPELGKDEFLKILLTQLQNQDPLDPMDDREFVSQMTTFSSLEQLMNMSKSIDTFVENQSMPPVVQFSHMIGKEVSYRIDSDENSDVETSTVTAVLQKEGRAILKLQNGAEIDVEDVWQVAASDKGE
ncbi:MAG TPA: flagellar hook assembly protein FlgD [Bacillota bacterium]|nr:flagellar hook assembly protein FlgD [Bacillota bacterium]